MKKVTFFTILLTILVSSCSTFEVNNDNPDVALSIDNNPELLLTQLQRNAIRRNVSDAWSEGNLMGQYVARIVFTSFDLFDWGSQTGTWNTYYQMIRDAKELEKIALNKELKGYQAVSEVMQVWMFSILTDVYGDIPYSEVAQAADENYTPAFDTQESIYKSMLESLKKASDLIDSANSGIKGDLVYNGDLLRWKKFANSLRLRLAMRLSEKNSETAKNVISEIYNNPSSYPIFENNEDNAELTFLSSNPDAHPISEESVYRVGSFNEYRISEHFVQLLEDLNDPRLDFFADPTSNSVLEGSPVIEGMQNGIVDGPAYEYKGGDAFLSKLNINYFYLQSNQNKGRLMTYSEMLFILSEAAQRGWISADANDLYKKGIIANFDYWEVPLSESYLNSSKVSYNGSLEQIITQKYISLFYTDYQGFFEYKRTLLPATIKPGPDAFYSEYPSRFEYPSEEQTLNVQNYNEAVSRLSKGDEITSKLWWHK